jgi:hypothetical protein
MAAAPEAPIRSEETTASPLDRHASPVTDHGTTAGPTRHGRATAAMIVSIIAMPMAILFFPIGLVLAIVGIVLGATARSDIKRRGMAGSGQATAAIVCGGIAILLVVALFAIGIAVSN